MQPMPFFQRHSLRVRVTSRKTPPQSGQRNEVPFLSVFRPAKRRTTRPFEAARHRRPRRLLG